MINPNVKVIGANEVAKALGELSTLTGKSIGKEVRHSAGRLAENMAIAVQPFGKDERAKQRGEEKVDGDVRRVYVTAGFVFGILKSQGDEGIANAFWLNKNKPSEVKRLLSQTRFSDLQIRSTVQGKEHKSSRVKGKVPKGFMSSTATLTPKPINAYIKKVERMVGFTKAGFTACAKQLGRRVEGMQWVTRHNKKAPHNVADGTKIVGKNPKVTFWNNVSHVVEVINETSWRTAEMKELAVIKKQIQIIAEKKRKNL